MSVKGRGPDRASGLDDWDRLRFSLVVVGYCVLRISSNVSSLMGGGYWAVSSSCGCSVSLALLGGCIPGARCVGVGATVIRRIPSSAGVVELTWSGGDLHGAVNTPGP